MLCNFNIEVEIVMKKLNLISDSIFCLKLKNYVYASLSLVSTYSNYAKKRLNASIRL